MFRKVLLGVGLLALVSCNPSKSIHKISVPANSNAAIVIPAKRGDLSERDVQLWPKADLAADSIPGMSIAQAYEFLADKEGKITILGVIDSGIDITHVDLEDNIWVNTGEIPNNGIDDDNNGYIDDIYGWNFYGGPKGTAIPEQLELTRLYKKYKEKYKRINKDAIPENEKEEYLFYKKLKEEYTEKAEEVRMNARFFGNLLKTLEVNDAYVRNELNKSEYTFEDLKILPEDKVDPYLINIVGAGQSVSKFIDKVREGKELYQEQADYNYNLEFNGRITTGDDVYDMNDTSYGNGYVIGSLEKEMHGTHVSGIAMANRNNGTAMEGVAHNVKLMAIRTIPDGDEYDKDVALAIRYAVDNGAKVINMSFGKDYSPNADWVYEAIKYAEKHDVLLVHAAGNDAKNIDKENNFPTDAPDKINELVDNLISVGSITRFYNENLVSSFSNYGRKNVDIFAPGSEIFSTVPNNEYESIQGTSMAAPAVAGVAILIRSFYPELSASQVKHIIMNSGNIVNFDVVLPGTEDTLVAFKDLSVSGSVINAYKALVLADKIVNKK